MAMASAAEVGAPSAWRTPGRLPTRPATTRRRPRRGTRGAVNVAPSDLSPVPAVSAKRRRRDAARSDPRGSPADGQTDLGAFDLTRSRPITGARKSPDSCARAIVSPSIAVNICGLYRRRALPGAADHGRIEHTFETEKMLNAR